MIEAMDILITKTQHSKLQDLDLENIPFGKYFTDHMLEANYKNGEWTNVEIKPYQPLLIEPSLSALHYGQAIFEGMKAYKDQSGNAFIFRPHDNFHRFNISAARMNMPEISEEIFMEGLRQLIELDKDWIPSKPNHSLYIRPLMFAIDTALGVKPSDNYKFLVMLSPTGPYYAEPMKIAVEEKYTRAAPGGVGYSKNAGNYGGSMLAATVAKQNGYDQVLWTDAFEHKWLQEVGMMNVFFIIDGVVITPTLDDGCILAGVTRSSAITLLKEMGLIVEERKISINEVIEAHKRGLLQEVFGTGTAATIAMIKELKYQNFIMQFDLDKWKIAPTLKKWIADIREGRKEDKYGWMWKV
ncbi:MAG TPA: branched-chain amino acid aminotransferase [Chitinophagaceae bacterium]|jgi:branched-chain amino acid aminotransferase|nr:branched-chain amino acid aminotransferase [Chitinophagaceae bacterium]